MITTTTTTTTTKYDGARRQNDVTSVPHDELKNSSTSRRTTLDPTTHQTLGRVTLNLLTTSRRTTLNPTNHIN